MILDYMNFSEMSENVILIFHLDTQTHQLTHLSVYSQVTSTLHVSILTDVR